MVWQDFVFTMGSVFSIVVLMPTLRDRMASIPLGTSVPSALIGLVYGSTFFTMDMVFSAAGAFATGLLWSLIALIRSPAPTGVDAGSEPSGTDPSGNRDAPAGQ